MIDLVEYYKNNVKKDDYYYRFYNQLITIPEKEQKAMEELDWIGNEYIDDTRFEVFDEEDAIKRFKELCEPDEDMTSNNDNIDLFYYICFFLKDSGYCIEEFPRLLERPPLEPFKFTYNEIRDKAIERGMVEENGTVKYNSRRKIVADLHFVRYADDCLIMVKSEKAANRVMESITTFITKKLGLKVNVEKSKIARPDNIKYLGFGFYKKINQNIWRPKPHIKSINKFKIKLRGILVRSKSISLDERLLKLKQIIYGWVNYFRIADMKMLLLREIDPWVRRKLRVIIWKQWKKIRRRYTCLRKLGISHRDAYVTANSRKGYYHIAHTRVIEAAISKERLNKRGLVNSLDHYLKVHVSTN